MAPDRRWSVKRSVDRREQPRHRFSWGRANCGDFEDSTTNGRIDTRPHPNAELAAEGVVQEGWVWVQPYWNPDQPVKVCAFDAQELAGANETNRGLLRFPATFGQANRSSECGCGPNLRWCLRGYRESGATFMGRAPLRYADSVVRNRPTRTC